MPFRRELGKIVSRASGAVGAVFVDDNGETIDQFTSRGDQEDIRLVGAHQGIVLRELLRVVNRAGNGDRLQGVSITSQNHVYSVVPVDEDNFLVLVQDQTGLPSQGMRVLEEAVEEIRALI
ncbi:MAG: roadblock/LC7 domain-containing protein [bacterium]|nr:MAG: roadblock/LC7 domain-containing protein [bacterium]